MYKGPFSLQRTSNERVNKTQNLYPHGYYTPKGRKIKDKYNKHFVRGQVLEIKVKHRKGVGGGMINNVTK